VGASCAIELSDGGRCDVPAIGRCLKCDRAMCTSHRGVDSWTGAVLIDRCGECHTIDKAEAARIAAEQSRRHSENYSQSHNGVSVDPANPELTFDQMVEYMSGHPQPDCRLEPQAAAVFARVLLAAGIPQRKVDNRWLRRKIGGLGWVLYSKSERDNDSQSRDYGSSLILFPGGSVGEEHYGFESRTLRSGDSYDFQIMPTVIMEFRRKVERNRPYG
jgi:hypothetical protein